MMNFDHPLRKETEAVLREFRTAVAECRTAEDMEWDPVSVRMEVREFTADELQAIFCYGLDGVFMNMRDMLMNFWLRLGFPLDTAMQTLPEEWQDTARCVIKAEMKSRMARIWTDHAQGMNLAACVWMMEGKEKILTFRGMNSPYWLSRAFAADCLFSIGSMGEILSSPCDPAGMSLYRECLFGSDWMQGGRQLEGDFPEVKTKTWPPREPLEDEENGPCYPFAPTPAGIIFRGC